MTSADAIKSLMAEYDRCRAIWAKRHGDIDANSQNEVDFHNAFSARVGCPKGAHHVL